mgnify:CR=1 FL=1
MEDTLTITQARNKLLALPEKLSKSKTAKAVAVTKRGQPILAIVEWELYESILETLEVMGDPELMQALRRSVKEAQEGKIIPWKKAKRQLGL